MKCLEGPPFKFRPVSEFGNSEANERRIVMNRHGNNCPDNCYPP